jgi:outer membrane protein assembly factor BamA
VQDTVKDVVVEAVEAARLQFEPYFGYYLAEGVRGGLDLQLPNLFGKAVSASADVRAYYFGASAPATTGRVDVSNIPQYLLFGGRGNISVSKRLAFGGNWDFGLRANTFFERVFRQSYQFNRFAAVPGFDVTVQLPTRPSWPRLKIALLTQYEFDVANVREVKSGEPLQLLRVDQERLRFSYGTFGLSTVRFAPTLDFRDDASRPRCCVVVSFPIEYTTANFAVDQFGQKVPVEYIKISGSITGYVPIGKGVVLALSARAGNVFPLRPNSITPPVKRFFVGGATSLRGFPEDSLLPEDVRATYRANVRACESLANPLGCTDDATSLRAGRYVPSPGGEVFAVTKAELRFPFVGDFNLGVFGEAGNLWLDSSRIDTSLRPVAGVGLRYLSPIGPLALDVGFNLLPDLVVNEPIFNIHFNVGVF